MVWCNRVAAECEEGVCLICRIGGVLRIYRIMANFVDCSGIANDAARSGCFNDCEERILRGADASMTVLRRQCFDDIEDASPKRNYRQ